MGRKRKPRKSCLQCGKECNGPKQVYCSCKCQQKYNQNLKVQEWLKTGECNCVGIRQYHYVKRYLLECQEGKCAVCRLVSKWNNKNLVFILDHIDGDSENGHRDNLRLICPNCDSQLDTYKARNRGRGRYSRRKRYVEGKSY